MRQWRLNNRRVHLSPLVACHSREFAKLQDGNGRQWQRKRDGASRCGNSVGEARYFKQVGSRIGIAFGLASSSKSSWQLP
jgi:hypothetical protein